MPDHVDYAHIAAAIEPTGMVARGGFLVAPLDPGDDLPDLPASSDGRPCRTVIVIGNISGHMWPAFRAAETPGPHPLDRWTRSVLEPIATEMGATYVHPSDEPFQPFQRWARRSDDVWQSPIGLLIHPDHGLWHAYRGALLFAHDVAGLPKVGGRSSPCLSCVDQPCLSTCPVDAFTPAGYDSASCAAHVRSTSEPDCLADGCAARRACPVGVGRHYGRDQMHFHMQAFAGPPR